MDACLQHPAAKSDGERLLEFNQTDRPFPDQVTLHSLIERQVAARACQIAVVCSHDAAFGAGTLTYAQLNEKANQLARRLRASGVQPEEVVGLMVDRSFAMIIGILGILKAGAAYLPIAPDHPGDRVGFMLHDCRARFLLTQARNSHPAPFEGEIVNLEDPAIYQGPAGNLAPVTGPESLAYVIYTSGSTGRPKGVMIEHRSVVNRLHWMQSAYPIGPTDVILQKTPYFFDVSVWELFWWGLAGAKLCFLAPGAEKVPMLLLDAMQKQQVSVLHFVPSMLNVFLDYLEGKPEKVLQRLASLRRIFASGEALSPGHVRKFHLTVGRATQAQLINLYGPTEATVDVSYFDCPDDGGHGEIPIGRPIDNTRFHILKDGRPAAIGEAGELCIAGVGLARGYINNPALTQEKFIDNPAKPGERIYRTGDLARWRSDGNVVYLGRIDHQVKIRGLRIELGEIENVAREHPGISDCVVVTKQCSESIILIIAYLVARGPLELSDLKAHLKRHLPDYMVPNHFERIDRVPLGPSGKADRSALPEPKLLEKPL